MTSPAPASQLCLVSDPSQPPPPPPGLPCTLPTRERAGHGANTQHSCHYRGLEPGTPHSAPTKAGSREHSAPPLGFPLYSPSQRR